MLRISLVFLCLFQIVSSSDDTTPVSVPQDELCPCNIPGIWLDIMVLFESSKAMTLGGMIEAAAFVATALQPVDISQLDGQKTRVGVVTYSSSANIYAQLDRYNSTNDFVNDLIQNLPFEAETGTNIQAAIKRAVDEFDSPRHRYNAKKVIVIVGSDYDAGGSNSPTVAADQFKGSGGTIITICLYRYCRSYYGRPGYVQNAGAANEMLRSLASDGFALDSKTDDLSTPLPFQALFCRANCFCRPTYEHYIPSSGEATNVCIYNAGTGATQIIASPTCARGSATGKGHLVREETKDKQTFVAAFARNNLEITGGPLEYWIELKRNGANWTWADGSWPVQNEWATGEPTANGDCVRTVQQGGGFSVGWVVTDCNTDTYYVCQEPTCDSQNYCSWDETTKDALRQIPRSARITEQ